MQKLFQSYEVHDKHLQDIDNYSSSFNSSFDYNQQIFQKYFETDIYKQAVDAEKEVLTLSQLKYNEQVKVMNVTIKMPDGSYQWIHTYMCGDIIDDYKKIIVLIHGFGGSSLTFYSMIKYLIKEYRVFCIDLIGMGLSSRPQFELDNPIQIINYFLDSIEAWRKQMDIDKMFLIGHSLGGYLATNYCLKYQKYVEGLILISPAGTTRKSQTDKDFQEQTLLNSSNFIQKIGIRLTKYAYKMQLTPSQVVNFKYLPSNMAINRYLQKKLKMKKEAKYWKHYVDAAFQFRLSTEKAFHFLFSFPKATAIFSLEELIKDKLSIQVYFLFGENDWNDMQGAQKMLENRQIQGSLTIVQNVGHQMIFEDPEAVCNIIMQKIN